METQVSDIYNHVQDHLKQEKKKRILKSPEVRKQEIIKAALDLFSKNGYNNTTIQDIAESIGVSQGLCYRYFKSKDEIFLATSDYYALKEVEEMKVPFDESMSAIEKINFLMKKITEYAINNYKFEVSFNDYSEEYKYSGVRASKLDSVAKQMVEVLEPIAEQGVREHVFLCKDTKSTVNFIAYGMIHVFHSCIPKENAREYIISFLLSLKELLINNLKIINGEEIGKGWLDNAIYKDNSK